MSPEQHAPHEIQITGERENVTVTIDGEHVPVRYVDGAYIATHHSFTVHRSAQELAEYVARSFDHRRP